MKSAVEVWHQRYDHVGLCLVPMLLEQSYARLMVHAVQRVNHFQALTGAECPPFRQHFVIDILQSDARGLTENVQRVKQFLKMNQADLPRPALPLDHRFERRRRRAMASTGIEVNEINLRHDCFIPESSACDARA